MKKTIRLLTILLSVCMVSAFLAGCTSPVGSGYRVTLAAPLHLLEEDEIDIEALLVWAEATVRPTLPDAYYQDMLYWGKPESLLNLRGRFVFRFGQRIPRPFQRGFVSATVVIHTETGLGEIVYLDQTGRYWDTTRGDMPDQAHIRDAISMTNQHLLDLDVAGCVVGISHYDDRWLVICYHGRTDCACLCTFEIVDGKVRDLPGRFYRDSCP